jgi:hypothetical protein
MFFEAWSAAWAVCLPTLALLLLLLLAPLLWPDGGARP